MIGEPYPHAPAYEDDPNHEKEVKMICPILTSHFQPPVENARPVLIHAECQLSNCQWWMSITLKDGRNFVGCAVVVLAAQKLPVVK